MSLVNVGHFVFILLGYLYSHSVTSSNAHMAWFVPRSMYSRHTTSKTQRKIRKLSIKKNFCVLLEVIIKYITHFLENQQSFDLEKIFQS